MGDVRVPAAATLLAALVAVAGSIFVVYRSGRQQQELQRREFAEQRRQRSEADEAERERAARAGELDACVHFDAAVVLALAQLTRIVDLAQQPQQRRRLFGWAWAKEWSRRLDEDFENIAVPYAALRLTARSEIRDTASRVMEAMLALSEAMRTVPSWLPPWDWWQSASGKQWRDLVSESRAEVQQSRDDFARAVGSM